MNIWVWKKASKELVLGHAFSKACQYSTIEEKVCKNLKYISLNLLKQILKSASLGLKNIGRENNNGIRLVLKLEFG
jgi:hypothetical protein